MTGIYCFKNLVNGKVYIGQSVNIQRRYKQHLSNINNLKHQEAIYLALRKYGVENFSFEILKECDINNLSKFEQYYISKYDAYGCNGYNETVGGEGSIGYKHTKESKEKMSASRKGRIVNEEWKQHMRDSSTHHTPWNKDKKLSEEHKEKISNSLSGHKHTIDSKEKMSKNSVCKKAVICNGEHFDSVVECAKYYDLNTDTLRSWLSGKIYMPEEFYKNGLMYENTCPNYVSEDFNKVICDGILYDNITECSKSINVNHWSISKWLNGTNKMPEEFVDRGLSFVKVTRYKISPTNLK